MYTGIGSEVKSSVKNVCINYFYISSLLGFMNKFLIKDNPVLINFVGLGKMSKRLIFNASLKT